MPAPTASRITPSASDAAVSKRWCPYGWSSSASFWLCRFASSTTKSTPDQTANECHRQSSPCDFDSTPTTICAVDSSTFTTTLTHVEREAAAARSAGEIGESSSDSVLMVGMGIKSLATLVGRQR